MASHSTTHYDNLLYIVYCVLQLEYKSEIK